MFRWMPCPHCGRVVFAWGALLSQFGEPIGWLCMDCDKPISRPAEPAGGGEEE